MTQKRSISVILAAMAAFSIWSPCLDAQVPDGPSIVKVSGKRLIVQKRLENGSLDKSVPYTIKGVTWSPATRAPDEGPDPNDPSKNVPYGFFFDWPGRNPHGHDIFRKWMTGEYHAYYKTDIPLIREMNANTVRLYNDFGEDPAVNSVILDEFYKSGIMVIMSVAVSREELESSRYLRIVELCKRHPAILMWTLGNEWNLENNKYYGYATVAEAARATNLAAKAAKAIDPDHPVSSCLGDRFGDPVRKNTIAWIVKECPDIDIWGLNIYRGKNFSSLFKTWKSISDKPFYISEFGIDSFYTDKYVMVKKIYAVEVKGHEDQKAQADWDINIWRQIKNNLSSANPKMSCAGGLVHSFNDQPWKVGSYHVNMGGIIDYNDPNFTRSYSAYNAEGVDMKSSFPDRIANEEYFGILDADRKPKAVYYALQKLYKNLR